MRETKKAYRNIVRVQVLTLEQKCRCHVVDGQRGICPRCGELGTWDLERIGFHENYGNSIYYSTVFNEWRCRMCDFRMHS